MGYFIHYKDASLTQIFTLSANKYSWDCHGKVCDIIRAETPRALLARETGGPTTWNMDGELTEAMKAKLEALPFVKDVQTEAEAVADFVKPKSFKDKLRGFVRSAIY